MAHTTASALIGILERYGVRCVFGIPGVHTLELYRGLATSSIQHITPRHEQGAGFMADGYARVSGKPGVCFIISGPGMTNVLTAMGQAYSESLPMLVISSVNSHGRMGSGDGWLHELSDQHAVVKGVCAFSHTVHHADELPQVLARAFAVFDSQRPRPVHIEIPINILSAPYSMPGKLLRDGLRLSPPRACAAGIRRAANDLSKARCPVLLIGGGAVHASDNIVKLAQWLDAPVVMTVNARGVIAHHHPLAVPASASLSSVRQLIAEADVVLGIGTEMGPTDYDFNEDGQFEVTGHFIRIDIDAQQLVRNQTPQLGLTGDSKGTTSDLLLALEDHHSASSLTGASRAAAARHNSLTSLDTRYQRYIRTLEYIRDFSSDVVIVGDSTQIIYAGNCTFGMSKPSSYFNSAMGFGTLGYALPAAIGAAIADYLRPVVAISGDGGLQFCLAELATAVDEKLNLTLIVHENGGYQEINRFMQEQAIEPVGVNLLVPDLQNVAAACGWHCIAPDSLEQLPDILSATSTTSIPTLVVLKDRVFDDICDT
ncbi:MAG: 5-guanidino-2-oxopentanoate decarboxylase [Granulosicoccus sp.]